ncbi:hypothetical protein HDV02_003120 [Globomyces sp. JEL0801]|nr:hypothetical protein HDV02_003120 [Globomyces sp. JEL0801]
MIVNTQDAGYSATKQSTQEYVVPFDLSKPVYPDTIQIHVSELDFSSKATTRKAFKQDEVICNIKGITDGVKRWTSVQFGRNRHIELNSELVYMNHSCEPSVKLDCEKQQIIAMKELKVGDELCFFYPSPVYPDLIKVEESLQDFSSKAVTLKKFAAGEKVCDIVGITEGFKVWTSVQFGENRHIELNSELNHSCDPSIRIDPEEQAIYALKDLNVNDELSFFYPSPVYEDLISIHINEKEFSSKATIKKEFKKDQVICEIKGITESIKRWTSVQFGANRHIELNSELVYMLGMKLHFSIQGEFLYTLTFSTEWDMSQGFDCWCGATTCLKSIRGAKHVPESKISKFYFAPHILELLNERQL